MDFCTHRTEVGLDPACAGACPTEALRFGDFDDENDPVTRYAADRDAEAFKEDAGTRPSVLFAGFEAEEHPRGRELRLFACR